MRWCILPADLRSEPYINTVTSPRPDVQQTNRPVRATALPQLPKLTTSMSMSILVPARTRLTASLPLRSTFHSASLRPVFTRCPAAARTLPFARSLHASSSNYSKMGPPEKKMKHLEAINAIPSLYPDFRTVLWTGESSQLVVMTVPVGGDIGEEVSAG